MPNDDASFPDFVFRSSWSRRVTWGVSQDELAETETERSE
jgi:hypothetical protein